MNGDIIVGIFSAVFSAAYVVAAWLLPDAAIGNPMAPKYFPLMVGLLALAFSLALIVRGAKKGCAAKKGRAPDPGHWVLIGGLIACCLAYAAILDNLGFLISTPLFLGAMLFLVNGVKGWKANVATALCFSFGVWYIFEKIFQITLP
ncbi:tripartite tricarboxylate transporter TctB family protein [Cloacibacillus evryensis]|uniref:Tripartite tricarboxylate transporter TctB family protein n=1 Tax=Cloacibacillus evryensis TaxID=508460 RepID=A0AAW5K8U4_9BACT|nr:tripartite tricarboxylate transporter TctB family protein [Cloacibacillus evryensis]EHL67636.1 hypothetical protein HMPREF1006_01263 [Synergistes sp. 3_1_syn1]EXG78490.1 hypothetical protein Cloev_0615 [Cloacibacillus evryensis DSM 19522]MCQ4764958.1 tripartite tricarboxylate transporter TctB family protein [Cloacibacillus evryensis]MCQ4814953.1 tripartite tricarboxylate transporter TctB family protein [Cloacibacillus evryensis]MEA5036183.1 tripartite tricarboxylate transporter TctB family 